jgi:hypothetical protein
MKRLSNMPDNTDVFQYFFVLGESGAQQHDYNPLLSRPSFTIPDSTSSVDVQSGPPVDICPPTTTTRLLSHVISFDTSSTTAPIVNQSNVPSSTNKGRAVKTYPCQQCGKEFSRRTSAEACENRHLNAKPFQCGKRCGDPGW